MGVQLWRDDRTSRDGSCRDTESYYTKALSLPDGELCGEIKLHIQPHQDGNPLLLVKKNYGDSTALTLRPLVLSGIDKPIGSVVRFVSKSDGTVLITPLRVTAFTFDDPAEMKDAFGTQVVEIQSIADEGQEGDGYKPGFVKLHQQGFLTRVAELLPETTHLINTSTPPNSNSRN